MAELGIGAGPANMMMNIPLEPARCSYAQTPNQKKMFPHTEANWQATYVILAGDNVSHEQVVVEWCWHLVVGVHSMHDFHYGSLATQIRRLNLVINDDASRSLCRAVLNTVIILPGDFITSSYIICIYIILCL